jgi:GT2 family glycosyltransferase
VSPSPAVSVVVPTVGRETRLAFLLEALAEQTLPRERFEVIVVRGRRPGEPAAPVDETGALVIEQEPAGASVLRNRGLAEARGELVAFIDDDSRPAPDWLERLVEAAGEQEGDFVLQGRIEPDPDEMQRLYGFARSHEVTGPSPWYQAGNIAYPRALVERLGGFRPEFDRGGEDADLGLRAVAAGARPVYVDAALVWHAVHSQHLWSALRDAGRWQTIPLILARHPEQRKVLERGLFWKPGPSRALLALLGILTLRKRPLLGIGALAPYVRHHVCRYERTPRALMRAALDLPGSLLVDAAAGAASIRAAARYRAPMI